MVSEPKDVRAVSPTLLVITGLGVIASIVFAVLGVWLVIVGGAGADNVIDLFGQEIETTNVGVASIFVAAVTAVITIRSVLKVLKTAVLK